MSIRPVDMQVSIQKSPDINRAHNNETNRSEVAQQQFSQRLQREVEQKDQQVIQSNKTEGRNIDKDGKGNAAYNQSSKKRRQSKNTNEKDKEKQNSSSLLDISI